MKRRDIQKLIGESAGRCNFPDCSQFLFYECEDGSFVKLGEFCHIIGESPAGPRGSLTESDILKEDPDNIILLCRNHHKVIDGDEKGFTVTRLREMKQNHVLKVERLFEKDKRQKWILIIHSGNVTNSQKPIIDRELIMHEFLETHDIIGLEKISVPEYLVETRNWDEYRNRQETWWSDFINQTESNSDLKLILCSINFIPLAIHLGYIIHDTFAVECHQFLREKTTWKWDILDDDMKSKEFFSIEKNVENCTEIEEIVLSISISAQINDDDILDALKKEIPIIKLNVENPNRAWLRYEEQLIQFQKVYISLLDDLLNQLRNLKRIHLFYAGPTPFAFKIGNSINPNMHPEFVLYNYHFPSSPKYSKTFNINQNAGALK